jgi:hypothetical protein
MKIRPKGKQSPNLVTQQQRVYVPTPKNFCFCFSWRSLNFCAQGRRREILLV